jgi:hypothetical protein
MKCDVISCHNNATQIRAVPFVGDFLRCCNECVAKEKETYNEDFGWEILTPEREQEEISADEAFKVYMCKFFKRK